MQILLIGAGKSSTHIIEALSNMSSVYNYGFVVADLSASNLSDRCSGHQCEQVLLKNGSMDELEPYISASFLVISMLPPSFHVAVAKLCLVHKVHLITPSYISQDMQAMDSEVKNAGLIFLNEMGLDPGIDHMCCMKIIDEQKSKGSKIISLRSHCGALISPQSDTNLWHYKVSWNPRNIVLAGAGSDFIKYRLDGKDVLLNYNELFSHASQMKIDAYLYESYPNRDSLKYERTYDIVGVETLYRGTLRVPPFCKAWNVLVNLGATSTVKPFPKIEKAELSNDLELIAMLEELGVFDLHVHNGIAYEVFQMAIEKKWAMNNMDIDRVVMIHELVTEDNKGRTLITSSLILDGENQLHTALSKTVGLPIVFAVELILQNSISQRGVLLPIHKEFYEPILEKLSKHGIMFKEYKTICSK